MKISENEKALLERILDVTCKHYGVKKSDVKSIDRYSELVEARAMYAIVADEYVANKSAIATVINRHHSSIYNWFRRKFDYKRSDAYLKIKSILEFGQEILDQKMQLLKLKSEFFEIDQKIKKLTLRKDELVSEITSEEKKLENLMVLQATG